MPCFPKLCWQCVVKFLFFVCIICKCYFFSLETSGFVDKLFESLYTKNYLPPLEPVKPEPKPLVQEKEDIKEEVMQIFSPALGGLLDSVTSILSWKLSLLKVIAYWFKFPDFRHGTDYSSGFRSCLDWRVGKVSDSLFRDPRNILAILRKSEKSYLVTFRKRKLG